MSNLIYNNNLKESVALGHVEGWEGFRKFGMNDSIGAGTEEMWPLSTLRVLPTTAGAFSLVSDSADDSSAGTGARTITVEGLDSNYEQISETVTTNGVTPVVSVGTDWFRINRAYNVTAGTGEINAGGITISIGGDTQAYIEATQGQTHQTHYTVPAGKYLMIRQYRIQTGRMGGNTDLHVLGQILLFGTTAWRSISDIWLWNGASWTNDYGATLLPPKTELRQRIVSTVATQASGVVSGYLIRQEQFKA
jgi:hypothetical protein